MAEYTLKHLVVGSDTYEVFDETARAGVTTNAGEISSVKQDLQDIQGTGLTSDDEGKALKIKTVTNGSVSEWEFGTAGGVDPSDIQTAVDEYLTEHPVVASAAGIVSVATYGAVGDGVTDDSAAIQTAVNNNYDVYFESNKTYYLASAVTIDHDIKLHGGENTVIKTATPSGGTVNRAFYVHGTLKDTTTLTTDYTSTGSTDNSSNQLTLADMSNVEIGDVLVVKATDQFYSYTRTSYYLGATLLVTNKTDSHVYVGTSMPWDMTLTANLTVQVYDAPSVIFDNLNFVSDLDSFGSYNALIRCLCAKPTITNCTFSAFVMGVYLEYCANTYIENLELAKSKNSLDIEGDGYGVMVLSCTNTTIQRVYGFCGQSCIDLGGDIPCIDTFISKCELASEVRECGIGLHENSYNLVVEDCVLCGINAYGTVTITRCRFVKNNMLSSTSSCISFRGSHNPEWARIKITDCEFGSLGVYLSNPIPQSAIQAIDNVIGSVIIDNCIGGLLQCVASTSSSILSNTVNSIVLNGWTDCDFIYHPTDSMNIKLLKIRQCAFTNTYFIRDGSTFAVSLDDLDYLDYSSYDPMCHKISMNKDTYGETVVLPKNVPIQLTSDNASTQFIVCGNNITPNVADDYMVADISGSVGASLTRTKITGENKPSVSVDSNGDPVYSQGSDSGKYSLAQVGMVYASENSTITMTASLKNTGATDGATFYPYIAIVDCDTGLVTYRGNGSSVTATEQGATITHNRSVPKNSVVLCYFLCRTVVVNSETTFADYTVSLTPLFASAVIDSDEDYSAKRITGSGTILSLQGVNHIMCSDNTFNVKLTADYVNNPVGSDFMDVSQDSSGGLVIS